MSGLLCDCPVTLQLKEHLYKMRVRLPMYLYKMTIRPAMLYEAEYEKQKNERIQSTCCEDGMLRVETDASYMKGLN